MASADLPVDLLVEILLRLDDAADLVRASAVCTSFRSIVSDGHFRRRFRSLHRRPVLGFLGHGTDSGSLSFYPAELPRRSAPAARALAGAADFSLSSLAEPVGAWRVSDVCDGRVLLSRRAFNAIGRRSNFVFNKFVVYDPLHRRHVQVPSIPTEPALMQYFEPFLLPAAAACSRKNDDEGGGGDDPSSFRLLCIVVSVNVWPDEVHATTTFFYSSVTGKWRAMATLDDNNAPYHDVATWIPMRRHYAHGCFYWKFCFDRAMLMLDTHEMKFSVVDLPAGSECQDKIIVEVPDQDRVGILIHNDQHTLDLYSINKTCWRDGKSDNDGVGGNDDWRHDDGIPLLSGYQYWSLCGAAEGYALLRGVPQDKHHEPMSIARYFTVDIKTSLVEQLCELETWTTPKFLYANFPPPFTPPIV